MEVLAGLRAKTSKLFSEIGSLLTSFLGSQDIFVAKFLIKSPKGFGNLMEIDSILIDISCFRLKVSPNFKIAYSEIHLVTKPSAFYTYHPGFLLITPIPH